MQKSPSFKILRNNRTFTHYINPNFSSKKKKFNYNDLQGRNNVCFSPTNKSYYNFPILHKNMNIDEQIEKYQHNSHLRINLKIVGEGIKQKLFEMNENENENEVDEKKISSPVCTKKFSKSIMKKFDFKISGNINNLITTNNNEGNNIKYRAKTKSFLIPNNNLSKKISDLENNTETKNNLCNNLIKLNICENENSIKIKNNKKKDNLKNNENKKLNKYRKINRKKNLYDSFDDNESDEEGYERVINPETKFILFFDLVIFISYLYSFLIITINLANAECLCNIKDKINYNDFLLYMIDILYIFDLLISFFRSYYNFELKLINKNCLIILNYVKGDFFLDFLEAIPFFTINKYICFNNKSLYYCYNYEITSVFFILKMSNTLKILKIVKILGTKKNQALDMFLELISNFYNIERIFLLIIEISIYLGIIHFFVCFHIFIGKHSYSNWLLLTKIEDKSFFNIYICSLYFSTTTITTVGYGDITCSSFEERIFHIILLAIGCIFYSYIISSISNFIKNDSNAIIKYNNELIILENIRIANPNISFKLYKNILKYLEKKTKCQEKIDMNSLLETLPFTLKNNIIFTIYKYEIKHFKFFKKNENSEFISQALSNFISMTSKKNDFLIYEGEMLEEIIFIKDGKISFEAAINVDNPSISIQKYFNENFHEFNNEKEKKIIESHLNDTNFINKTGYVSIMGSTISIGKAKNKIAKTFQTMNAVQNSDNINNLNLNSNIYSTGKNNEILKFDINGGAIKNEEGNYQYLKILDMRKNEHFGIVFITLNKPCPLSLQVKSKFVELFSLKKIEAINLSKSYPNIWKKLYVKEFHNLRTIKKRTFKVLTKYIEVNKLLIDLNLDETLNNNIDLTINDLNEVEKSIFANKKLGLKNNAKRRKTIFLQKPSSNIAILHSLYHGLRRLSHGKFTYTQKNNQNKVNKKSNKNNDKDDSSYSSPMNSNLTSLTYIRRHKRVIHFSNDASNKKLPEKNNVKNNLGEIDGNTKTNKFINKKEKLKLLKRILKNIQTKLKSKKDKDIKYKILKRKDFIYKGNLKQNIKRNSSTYKDNNNTNQIKNKNRSTINLNIVHENLKNNNDDDSLFKELKDFYNEETSFSFCSNNKEKVFDNLSITKNLPLKILSSYDNLNQISKGQYLSDFKFQNIIKNKIKKNYCDSNSDNEFSLSLKSIDFSLDDSDLNNGKSKRLKKKINILIKKEIHIKKEIINIYLLKKMIIII